MTFHQEETLGSALHRHAISFQSGAVNSTSEMIPMGDYYSMNSSAGNLMFCDNSSIISTSSPATTPTGNPSSSLLLDSVPGLKNEIGLAAEWTEEEQYKLEEGLIKFKHEPSIMKYIKIAATLRDKTVRDVALRCRWMTVEEKVLNFSWAEFFITMYAEKCAFFQDKFGESSSKTNLSSASIPNMAACCIPLDQIDQNQRVKCEVLSSKAKQLLEQNFQAFAQINNNLSSLKLQDNIDLFCRTRDNINNINVILDNMKEFSGKIQMRELPISIDHNPGNSILPHATPVGFKSDCYLNQAVKSIAVVFSPIPSAYSQLGFPLQPPSSFPVLPLQGTSSPVVPFDPVTH
ncbi:hypothetical protein Cgig2_006734 [Carnegiea gigantea]|uniref:Uncharacterized protein n=1 Tax=Carnegiea gigantea TaxID=171969 RepID=A0A9Q1K1F2_9CARY|nr:hypothetical protein Cgig2_006734 [Carnegiea gigantea]